MKPTPKKQNGFTLIEIVIVLAIAALIMVIVFLAVQGAQRSRRDTQRKNDANRMLALAENAAGGSGGNYPGQTGGIPCGGVAPSFVASYLNKENFKDPSSGNAYQFGNFGAGNCVSSGTPNLGGVFFSGNATCSNGVITSGGGARRFAVSIGLETGTYCISN